MKYNPFKMIGSWFSGALLLIISYFSMAITQGVFCPKLNFVVSQTGELICYGSYGGYTFFGWLGIFIFGFLIGWGIESAARRF